MKSLIDYVLFFKVTERNGLALGVGDYFNTSFTPSDAGPFYITDLSDRYITFVDMGSGSTIQHDMDSFKRLLPNHIYKIDY